jgi:adenosylmethionine-8-amino-7-oxononanoate aminotransferase
MCRKIRDHGILLRPLGDTIVIFPPLTIGEAQLKQIVDAVREVVSEIEDAPSVASRGDDQIAGDF